MLTCMLSSYRQDLVRMVRESLRMLYVGGILTLTLAITCSLISYDPYDPSGNVIASHETQNWIGTWGAFIADFLFQWIGVGAFVVPLWGSALCWRLFHRQSLSGVMTTALAGVFFLSLMQPHCFKLYPNALAHILFLYIPRPIIQGGLAVSSLGTLIFLIKPWQWRPSQSKPSPKPEVKVHKPLKVSPSALPSLELLRDPLAQKGDRRKEIYLDQLQEVLEDFGVKGQVLRANPGPIVTLYELEPSAGVKSSRVISLADDIARSMSALSARVAVISGKNLIGIELSNVHREMVYLKELLASEDYHTFQGNLPLVLGKDISGKPVIVDLAKMPHLLVAGTTGSGKSVGINSMILSLLYRLSPDQCKFIMIDPKMLELSVYDGIPHLLTPVVTEPKKAIMALKWVVQEMENRYRLMSKLGVRHIGGYHQRFAKAQQAQEPLYRQVQVGFDAEHKPILENQVLDVEPMPFIVVVVDEMADLMLVAGKEVEILVQRLAQMARAAGIHIIMATQRPSVDVITGTIKANFPTRISFQVTSKIDSRTILGEQGAEHLLGQGDMLYMASGSRIMRVHGPFVSDQEIESVVSFLKSHGQPSYIDMTLRDDEGGTEKFEEGGDDLYRQAVEIVRRDRKVSTSYLQRQLQIGYNRAARLVEQMEQEGLISPPNHVGKREILG